MTQQCSGATVYQKLITLMVRAKRHMFVICESRDITPVQGMLMISLKPGHGLTMHKAAEMMGCDASNVTGLTDRLEESGFIERTACETDRRVKMIRLTDEGRACRESILTELTQAEVLDMKQLSEAELRALHSTLDKLV